MKVVKKSSPITAFCLGEDSPLERSLIESGRLRRGSGDQWEVFTQECAGGSGQFVYNGDYIKFDAQGFPYPNRRDFFLSKHQSLGGNQFMQISEPLQAWQFGEPISEEMRYLLDHDLLHLHRDDPEHYFQCHQWNTDLSASIDAVVVFYQVDRDDNGISAIHFNFVKRSIFDISYQIL